MLIVIKQIKYPYRYFIVIATQIIMYHGHETDRMLHAFRVFNLVNTFGTRHLS